MRTVPVFPAATWPVAESKNTWQNPHLVKLSFGDPTDALEMEAIWLVMQLLC